MAHRNMSRTRSSARPRYQWFGGSELLTIETTAATSVSEVTLLRPAHVSLDAVRSLTHIRTILEFNIRRVSLTATVEGFNYVVAVQGTDAAGNLTDVLDVLSSDPFVWSNKNILAFGSLPVPPTIDVAGARATSLGTIVVCREVKAKRKMQLSREALTLTMAADVSAAVKVDVTWRSLFQSS